MPRWTEESRQKQARIIEKNKPWKKSTGPTSDAGKAQSCQNATKTGLYTQDYLALRRALIKQSHYLRKIEIYLRIQAQEKRINTKTKQTGNA